MSDQGLKKIIQLSLTAVLIGVIVLFGSILLDTYREYKNFREEKLAKQNSLETSEGKLAKKQVYLNKLANDPEFLERVARERLHLSKPSEIIFHFKDENTTVSNSPNATNTKPNKQP